MCVGKFWNLYLLCWLVHLIVKLVPKLWEHVEISDSKSYSKWGIIIDRVFQKLGIEIMFSKPNDGYTKRLSTSLKAGVTNRHTLDHSRFYQKTCCIWWNIGILECIWSHWRSAIWIHSRISSIISGISGGTDISGNYSAYLFNNIDANNVNHLLVGQAENITCLWTSFLLWGHTNLSSIISASKMNKIS